MQENIRVSCLIDRFWVPATKEYDGTEAFGTLINISTQYDEDNPEQLIPVGVVVLDDGSMQSVPIEFVSIAEATEDPPVSYAALKQVYTESDALTQSMSDPNNLYWW